MLLYFLFSLWQVWATGRTDQARPVDAIVVMGAAQYDGRPSPQLEARLDHAIELWPQDIAPLIVVTGGNRPGDRFTEAEASAAYLVDAGIPESAILLEDAGTSTYESLAGVAALLESRGLDSVLIVTDPYHALRSRMIADDLGLEALHVADHDIGGHRGAIVANDNSARPPAWRSGGSSGSNASTISPIDAACRRARPIQSSAAPVLGDESHRILGCGVIGNTAVSGTVIRGSSPLTPAHPARFGRDEPTGSVTPGSILTGSIVTVISFPLATWPVRLEA